MTATARAIETDVDIRAEPRWVWRVLTGLSAYEHWNPFIPSAHGRVETGRRIKMRIQPERTRSISLYARVTRVVDQSELRWEGRWLVPLLLSCQHVVRLHDLGSHHVRLHQLQEYRGVLVWLCWPSVGGRIESGIRAMNAALKRRAERVDRIASIRKPARTRGQWYSPDRKGARPPGDR